MQEKESRQGRGGSERLDCLTATCRGQKFKSDLLRPTRKTDFPPVNVKETWRILTDSPDHMETVSSQTAGGLRQVVLTGLNEKCCLQSSLQLLPASCSMMRHMPVLCWCSQKPSVAGPPLLWTAL